MEEEGRKRELLHLPEQPRQYELGQHQLPQVAHGELLLLHPLSFPGLEEIPASQYSDCSPIILLMTSVTDFINKDSKLVTRRDELLEQRFFLPDF